MNERENNIDNYKETKDLKYSGEGINDNLLLSDNFSFEENNLVSAKGEQPVKEQASLTEQIAVKTELIRAEKDSLVETQLNTEANVKPDVKIIEPIDITPNKEIIANIASKTSDPVSRETHKKTNNYGISIVVVILVLIIIAKFLFVRKRDQKQKYSQKDLDLFLLLCELNEV